MYIIENRIRYSEVDQDRQLKLGNILNYFQDCSTFQSEDLNLGLEMLKGRHRAWLLNSWQLEILRRPKLGETVQTGTYPVSYTHLDVYKRQDTNGTVQSLLRYYSRLPTCAGSLRQL